MTFVSFLDDDAGVGELMMHRPERYLPIGTFTQQLLRGPSAFTVAERELIATYVSALNRCQFCAGAHAALAEDAGVDPALLQALLADPDAAAVDARLRPVLAFARKLTLTPARMVQADADAVRAAGWDDEALSDLVAVCALFNLYNRLVDGHGIRGSEAYFSRLRGFIAAHGYEARTRQAAERRGAGGDV